MENHWGVEKISECFQRKERIWIYNKEEWEPRGCANENYNDFGKISWNKRKVLLALIKVECICTQGKEGGDWRLERNKELLTSSTWAVMARWQVLTLTDIMMMIQYKILKISIEYFYYYEFNTKSVCVTCVSPPCHIWVMKMV